MRGLQVRFGQVREPTVNRSSREAPVRPVIRLASFQAEKAAPKAKAAATPKARAASRNAGLPILTLDRFEQAMQIARLAAERDLPELNFRAVREALRAGPPVVPTNPTAERRAMLLAQRGIEEGTNDPVSPRVVANLVELERLWEKHHAPADRVYEVLRGVVLPAARPSEIFLYAPPPNPRALLRPRSAGSMLAAWAVRAGKADDLKRAIAERQGQTHGRAPRRDPLRPAGDGLGRYRRDRRRAQGARRPAQAGHPAQPPPSSPAKPPCPLSIGPSPSWPTPALEVLDGCAKGFENSSQPEPLGTLLILLARRQFQLGDAPGGRKRLDAYIDAMEKNASRYGGGDYPVLLRKQQFQRVASEYARAGLWPDALAALGRFVDTPVYSGGDPPVTDALVRLLRRLAASPAKERYETLRGWTMPAKDRQVVRILASQGARDVAPDIFARSEAVAKPEAARTGERR